MYHSEADAIRKDESLQWMEVLGETQPRRGLLVMELKAMIKDLLFSKEVEQKKKTPGICRDEQESASGQGAPTPHTNIRGAHEGQLIRIIR